jgi:Domain of unknown function (DUF3854)
MTDYGARLFPQHQQLLADSAISVEVASERGYATADTKTALGRLGFKPYQQRVPSMLIPVWDERGQIALHQHRPDSPRRTDTGKTIKYEFPAKARMVVDVPPRVRDRLGDPKVPLWLTEGVRKADAAVTAGLACLGLLGVWNWRGANNDGGKTALAFWEAVALNDRLVYVAFDSDVMINRAVHSAIVRLGAFLQRRGATLAYVYLPTGQGGAKVGLDDYLAAGGTVDELVRLARADPIEKPLLDEDAPRASGGDEKPGTTTKPPPTRRTLAEVETAFRAHHKHGDLVALRATLAAYAANMRLDGDPVWLGLVSGSSTGKTETALALADCPGVSVESTLSGEAALLSGTAQKDRAPGATGGLLRQIPNPGVLIFKDFTTVLSMHPDKRGQILAALREVYDGYWSRPVGTGGGQRLEWKGKLGLVMCSTTAYDRAHAVIAVMGDRFILVRLDDDERVAGVRAAIGATGSKREARAKIAAAAAGLLGHDPDHDPLEATDADLDQLADLADFVTMARSPVARDYKGEIELVLDPEGPYRFAQQLITLWRACGLLGLDREQAWEVAHRVARDSMPRLRWRTIDALAKGGEQSTNTAARAVRHPYRSTKRTLEDLTAHDVVERYTVAIEGGGTKDHWRLATDRAPVAKALAGVVPEISDPPLAEPAPEPEPNLLDGQEAEP